MEVESTEENQVGSQNKQREGDEQQEEIFKLAPFNPSSAQIQEKAMELLCLTDSDVLFDLGCGDGRFLVNAATRIPGLRCVGVEMDRLFVSRARTTIEALPDETRRRIDVREGDVLKLPLIPSSSKGEVGTLADIDREHDCKHLQLIDDATVVYLFILPKGVRKIMEMLEALRNQREKEGRDLRVLSYMFKIEAWEPTKVDRTSKAGCPIYLYEFNAPCKA